MFIVPITRLEGVSSLEEMKKLDKTPQKQVNKSFQNILTDAVKEADQAVKDTREMDVKLAAGQIDNLHTALIQAEQFAAAIEFTTQLTSEAVSAYTQIMGMQI